MRMLLLTPVAATLHACFCHFYAALLEAMPLQRYIHTAAAAFSPATAATPIVLIIAAAIRHSFLLTLFRRHYCHTMPYA